MKKRRITRKAQEPPPAGHVLSSPATLQYKVVELSSVDEQSLERTVNTWVRQGWCLENVQFAMRESSKRPAMAFVFFTREGPPAEEAAEGPTDAAPEPREAPVRAISAYQRLVELAESGDDPEDGP